MVLKKNVFTVLLASAAILCGSAAVAQTATVNTPVGSATATVAAPAAPAAQPAKKVFKKKKHARKSMHKKAKKGKWSKRHHRGYRHSNVRMSVEPAQRVEPGMPFPAPPKR